MTLIGLRSVEQFYGGRAVLRDLAMKVNPGARIGLIGGNGAGKSTLLRILAGLEEADRGEVIRRRGLSAAYLPQHVEGDGRTPLEVLRAARPELAELKGELEDCEARLGSPEVAADLRWMQRLLERHGRLLQRFTELGGRGFEGEARGLLRSLGLSENDVDRPTSDLSGGQRKLVAFGACLVQRPDVLLLDEPEAHLDAARRERLEALIRAFEGAVVIVSHDRYLLDETVGEIAELGGGKIKSWPGNYSAYALARELALKRQQQLYVAQRKEIARLEEAIQRFKQWAHNAEDERHARQARNKRRQIERMEKVERPVLERRKIGLAFRHNVRGGRKVLELREASVAFGEEPVLIGADLTVTRGERVGVVGENGAGKSVLAKLLAGILLPTEGERWVGPSIEIGYLAQDEEPPRDATPLSLVREAKPLYEDEAVRLLGRFLFRYDQVREPVGAMSGGERTRLQLLLLMLREPSCLILDEPTNHLDIGSLEVLETELERFPGTVVFVSHDRYFLDRIAEKIVEVRDGELHRYERWLQRLERVKGTRGGRVGSALNRRLPLQNYRDRPVVHDRHVHRRPEGAGLDRTDARLAEPLAEVVEEPLGLLRRGGPDEARALALAGVCEEGELRDGQDLTPDVSHAQVHLPILVVEDPQTRDLLSEPASLGFPVPLGDADEQQEAGAYLRDPLSPDRDGGVLYPLEDNPHGP